MINVYKLSIDLNGLVYINNKKNVIIDMKYDHTRLNRNLYNNLYNDTIILIRKNKLNNILNNINE